MLLKKLPSNVTKNGIIVVPSLSQPAAEGKFHISIHSDTPLIYKELSQKYNQTLSGSWVEHQAGGCHLHPKYTQENPKFKLSVFNNANFTITLRRPHQMWVKEIAKDSVGSMIGFYISSNKDFNPSGFNSSVDFVPMDEVSTEPNFALTQSEEAYYIMPTTFEPNKFGPFFLTVSSESQFLLVKNKTH